MQPISMGQKITTWRTSQPLKLVLISPYIRDVSLSLYLSLSGPNPVETIGQERSSSYMALRRALVPGLRNREPESEGLAWQP